MSGIDRILRFDLDVPAECAFRKAGAVNGWPTYPIPPLTTIRGMIHNAMARPSMLNQYGRKATLDKDIRDYEREFRTRFEEETMIGIEVLSPGIPATHFGKYHKRTTTSTDETYGPGIATVDVLVEPEFRVYVGATDGNEGLLDATHEALADPARPLYLGRSDDLVVIDEVEIVGADVVDEPGELDCVVPGATDETDQIELLPVRAETISRTGRSGSTRAVSIDGGSVDQFYRTDAGERFVFVDERR